MGEVLPDVYAQIQPQGLIEARSERLSPDAGAVMLGELRERSGMISWMVAPLLADPRVRRTR